MNNYEVLGVTKSATQEEIRQAYKSLARKHHPDKGGDAAVFSRISKAYRALKRKECSECQGRGFIDRRDGAFVTHDPCPNCFPSLNK